MDTTTSTVLGGDVYLFTNGYVSCIKVDGQPILPPLMTEKRREEMRRYKEQAIEREQEQKERKRQMLITPRSNVAAPDACDGDDEEKEEVGDQSEEGEDYASAASSTATFVIHRKSEGQSHNEEGMPTISSSASDQQDNEKETEAPQTVYRTCPQEEKIFKRKRPAKYFDSDQDDEKEANQPKCSSPSFSNLPNQVPAHLVPSSENMSPVQRSGGGIQCKFSTPDKRTTFKPQSLFKDEVGVKVGNLSAMSMGAGKLEHLERFLGEQENMSKEDVASHTFPPPLETCTTTHGQEGMQQLQLMFQKMQKEYEAQLQRMAEEHRLREQKMRKEFESVVEKLQEKFSTTLNTTDSSRSLNKASPESVQSSARSQAATSDTQSITLPVSMSENNTITNSLKGEQVVSSALSNLQKVSDSSVFHFKGGGSATGAQGSVSGGGPYELSATGLSKLQSKIHLMSPRLLRTPADARSPLVKGLLFLDPLDKPVAPLRIPTKALDPDMKPKFDRVSAAVRGFLTRRLLNTEKVQVIVQTIRDTVDLLLKLYEEAPSPEGAGVPCVKPQDNDLHQRLIQQLTGACRSFHDVFFKLSTKERMAIIATDREKQKAKALRSISSPAKPSVSNATLKSIERRMSHLNSRSSPKRDNRKSRSSKAYEPYRGSQSVKPKSIKVYDVSPKRRRISYWFDKNSAESRFDSSLGQKADFNGNSFKVSSNKTTEGSRSTGYHSGLGETFVVPSASRVSSNINSVKSYMGTSLSGRREPPTPKSVSARSTQSSISVASSSSAANRSRASVSRQPWNSARK